MLNQSLLAAQPTDPMLRARAAQEATHLQQVASEHTVRMVVLPRTAQPPVGPELLSRLVADSLPALV